MLGIVKDFYLVELESRMIVTTFEISQVVTYRDHDSQEMKYWSERVCFHVFRIVLCRP